MLNIYKQCQTYPNTFHIYNRAFHNTFHPLFTPLPISALPFLLSLLRPTVISPLCLKMGILFGKLLLDWVLGSLLLGRFTHNSLYHSKKTLVATLLYSPPKTNDIQFALLPLVKLILPPNSDGNFPPLSTLQSPLNPFEMLSKKSPQLPMLRSRNPFSPTVISGYVQSLLKSMNTGLKKTGHVVCGQMKPRLIVLGQMGGSGCGKGLVLPLLLSRCRLLSSLEEEM